MRTLDYFIVWYKDGRTAICISPAVANAMASFTPGTRVTKVTRVTRITHTEHTGETL